MIHAVVRPMKSSRKNRNILYDDITLLLIMDMLVCCTDLLFVAESRYGVGFVIIFLTIQNLVFNLASLLYEPIYWLKLGIKKCIMIKKVTNGQSYVYFRLKAM